MTGMEDPMMTSPSLQTPVPSPLIPKPPETAMVVHPTLLEEDDLESFMPGLAELRRIGEGASFLDPKAPEFIPAKKKEEVKLNIDQLFASTFCGSEFETFWDFLSSHKIEC